MNSRAYIPTTSRPSRNGIWCMVIKPSLEKTAQWRAVPIHSHVIEEGFLAYVEERQKAEKTILLRPRASPRRHARHPQFHKVAERIGEWVHGLGIAIGVKPNHGWRHLFKCVARHVKMDREVEGFITGHRPKDANAATTTATVGFRPCPPKSRSTHATT